MVKVNPDLIDKLQIEHAFINVLLTNALEEYNYQLLPFCYDYGVTLEDLKSICKKYRIEVI